jgi:localization factor PodJL
MPKASRAPDDYVTRLAHVSGGAYRQPPAMHAAASSADPAARREPQARAAAPSAAATQVLRDPPAAEGLRPHNQVPPAPPPPIVEKEPGKAGSRIMFPVAAASVVALMAGLGWAATSRYGESLHVTAMVERLKALPHVNDVLAMLGRPPGHGPQETVPASMGPPVSAETPVADLARAGAGAPLSSGARVAAPESRAGDMVAAAAPTAPVPVPPIPVRTRPEPESAPFPPSVPVVEARPSAAPQSSVAERPAEAADTPAAEANRAGRSLEERASVTGSIDAGPGASGSSAAALPKCPDYETAIISTGVTRCAPERPPAEPVARPERRSDAVTPAAPERQRVAAVTPAPAPARAAPPVPGQRPTLSAVEKAFFSKPLQDALVAEDAYASYDAGMRLLLGKGVPRDSKAAARWLKLAAEEGLAPAQYELGSIYELGTGVPKDIPLAMEWYGKAARSGNVRAMHNLGALLSDASFGTPDMESAAYWFRKAGEHGVRESQYNLGFLYVRGVGVPQDLTEAYLWFSLAAAQGDTNALKKKQMVMGLLDEDSLATAKRKAETFQGSIPDLAANTVDLSSKPWSRKKVIGS